MQYDHFSKIHRSIGVLMHPLVQLSVPQNHIGIQWFGQNSYAMKDPNDCILLVDPYFPWERPADEFIHPAPPLIESDLPVNIVLLTHDHGDHTCPETLQRIYASSPKTRFFGPLESIKRVEGMGVPETSMTILTAGEQAKAGNIIIHAEFSKPPAGIPEEGISIPDVEHLGYVIEMGGIRLYVSGDLIFSFAWHDELIQPIARLKPEIGFLTTHPTEGEFPDFTGSVELARKLGVTYAVPAHYDCFIKRTYDPDAWASGFTENDPQPILLQYNEPILFPARKETEISGRG
jgi:L-ascorbate metabolism protein UlaG (beta-lactamase superfamily)